MLLNPEWTKRSDELQLPTPEPWRQLLLDAAEVVREHGHTKYTLRDRDGFCLVGAMMHAAGYTAASYPEFRQNPDGAMAAQRLSEYLIKSDGVWDYGDVGTICTWNNLSSTTKDKAIGALIGAANQP